MDWTSMAAGDHDAFLCLFLDIVEKVDFIPTRESKIG